MKTKKVETGSRALRVLVLEDNAADAELVERELKRAGMDFTAHLVEGKNDFKKALTEFQPQVILSDFKLPGFDGLAALKMARRQTPDTPFIFVSGSIGEEKAIETLGLGASDYIFKDNLQRLGPAVRRVVADAELKLQKKKTEEELKRHVEDMRLLAEAADRFVHINDLDEAYRYLAQTIRDISEAPYLLLSQYDKNAQALQPRIAIGFEPFAKAMQQRLGGDLKHMSFYLRDMRPDVFSDFISRRLLPIRKGLFGFFNEKISLQNCQAIEKLLAVNAIFSMGFSWENQLFGAVTLFFKKNGELKNAGQVEALVNLAAVAIKRLLAEKDLLASETKYRTLVDQSPDGIFIIDLQGNFLSVNHAMCAGLKFSETEFLSMKIWDIVPEQYVDLHKKRLTDILRGKAKNEAAEYMVTGKDGETHVVEILSAPFYKDNELIGLQGIARETTEKKKMEVRLRESEEYYRTLVETSPDAIVICDGGGRITFVSRKAYELFRLPAEAKILGTSMLEFVEATEISRVQARLVEILSGHSIPEIREYRLQRRNGELFWADVSSAPLHDHAGRHIGLLLICRDVSGRKKAEMALRESEEKYRLIADNTAETITILDMNLRFTYVSPSIFRLRGYTAEEAQAQTLAQMLTADSLALISAVFNEEMALEASGKANPKRSRTLELQEYCKDGSVVWVENSLSFLRDAQGNAIGFLAVSKDISERKRVQEEILQQKAFLEKLIEAAPEGIAITDCPGRIMRVNYEFSNMFGFSSAEAVGKMIDDLVAPPGFTEEANALTAASGSGHKAVLETVRKKKDGSLFNVSIIGAPIFIADRQVAVYAIYRDIGERKRSEELINASLKEKEVLLQEIHHRVKNNLQIVSGLLTLQADHGSGTSLDEIFKKSQDRIRTIALVHEKLYRSHNLAEIAFDEYLRSLVEDLLISHGVGDRIAVCFETESVLFSIEKAVPLGLIVNELVSNALKHAFPEGRKGEIRIGLRFNKKARFVGIKTESGTLYRASQYELSVADDGIGLPPGFDPAAQKSLGMKLVTMLAMQLQSTLKLKPGPGTDFRLIISNPKVDNTTRNESKQGGI